MPNPLPLKSTATVVCMRALLQENPVEHVESSDGDTVSGREGIGSTQYLTRLLETDCFTAVSEEILHRIVKFCPSSLTNRLLHALAPPYIQGLNLDNCSNITVLDLVETLKKCKHIHRVNLSSCSQLIHPELFEFMGLTSIPLTTVLLEGNATVTDEVVHAMLKNLPGLEILNISCCSNISNDVFLLDEDLQRAREVTPHILEDDHYKSNLRSVDISGCRQLDTKAILHLVSFCGPKLTSLNLMCTSVNCTALLHLAGYSLPAILDFMLTVDALKSDKELKPVLQSYRELRDMYVELYEEEPTKGDKQTNVNKPPEVSKTINESRVCKDKGTIKGNDSDILVESDIKLELPVSQAEGSLKEECDTESADIGKLLNEFSLKQDNEEGSGSQNNQETDNSLGNMEIPVRKRVYMRNGEVVAVECVEHGENCESDEELDYYAGYPAPVAIASDKLNFDYDQQLFQPKIISLNIYGIQFVSRRPYLGQLCIQKFLEANKGLKKFSVSWKSLTVDFFRKVVHNLADLVDVELEECTLLQSAGVASLGRNCKKLQSVNLRSIVFIGDSALVPFLCNKNLQHLQLAESTSITDAIIIHFSKRLYDSLTSIDLSFCEEVTEKGINAICSTCKNINKIWLRHCAVSDFTLSLLSESVHNMLEISVDSADTNGDDNLTDMGILTIANSFTNLRSIDISWNLAITNLSVSAVLLNCSFLEEANFKGLKRITIQPFLPIIPDVTGDHGVKDPAGKVPSDDLPFRSTVYAPNLHVLDLDYSDLVNDQLLQKIVNVCRGTLQVTDYYGQKLKPE